MMAAGGTRHLYSRQEYELLEGKLKRLEAVIDKCRESAGLEKSPDGPSGDVTNLLHRGDIAQRKLKSL